MGDTNSQVVTIVKQVNSITSHSYPLESFDFVPRTALKKKSFGRIPKDSTTVSSMCGFSRLAQSVYLLL